MITTSELFGALGVTAASPADDSWAGQAVAAVNAYVGGLPWVQDHLAAAAPDTTWPPAATAGALMLAMRVYSARSAPLGMATLDVTGALQVAQTDPSVQWLLRSGRFTPPGVG